MAVNFEDDNNQQTNARPQQEQTRSFTEQKPKMHTGPMTLQMQSRIPDVVSANPGSESINLMLEAIKLQTEMIPDQYVVTAVPINGKDVGLRISAIVLVVQYGNKGHAETSRGLAFHTLLLEDTYNPPANPVLNIRGTSVEVLRPAGDAYDDKFRSKVSEILSREFSSIPVSKMYDAEAEVLPRSYNYKDKNQVQRTLHNALIACAVILAQETDQDLNDFTLGTNASNLNVLTRVSTRQQQQQDAVGAPVRTDVLVEFSEGQAVNNNQNQGIRSVHDDEQTQVMFEVGGFMDLLWEPEPGVAQSNMFQNMFTPQNVQQNKPTKHYRPRFVITSFNTSKIRTLPGQLLALVSSLALNEGGAWTNAFAPIKTNAFDMHDIGAIGYEINVEQNPTGIGNRFDTRSDNFRDQHLLMLLSAFLHPVPFISMDIQECGPETWITSVFLAAARANMDANRAIIEAADYLTAGNFKKMYQGNGVVVLNDNSKIETGYYINKDGVARDIRDVDYLAVLNTFGDKDMQIVKDFSDTFTRVDLEDVLRLQGRRKIINAVVNNQAVFTGYAHRVTFANDFLNALMQGVVKCGLIMRAQTPYQDASGAPRGTASFLQQNSMINTAGAFRGAFAVNQPNQMGNQYGGFGRWMR